MFHTPLGDSDRAASGNRSGFGPGRRGLANVRGNPAHTGATTSRGPEGQPELLWRFATTGEGEVYSVAYGQELVFVGSEVGLYAIDPASGQEVWRSQSGARVASTPAIADGVIYFGSGDDQVYALDAATGALHWSFLTGDRVTSSPAVTDGVMFVESHDDHVYALVGRRPEPYVGEQVTVIIDRVLWQNRKFGRRRYLC